MDNSGIYKITNVINDKIYVGSSINLKNRFKTHIRTLKNGNHKNIILQNFVNKYGIDSLNIEIIEYCDNDKLIENEQYYIDNLNSMFNICKIAGNSLGQIRTQITKDNIRYSLSKKIYQYDLNGIFMRSWKDCREAAENLNYSNYGIRACCKGSLKSFMNYMWSYIYNDKIDPYVDASLKKVCIYNKSFEFVLEFESIISASISLNVNPSLLSRICINNKGTAAGFYIAYKNTNIDVLMRNNSKKMIYVFSKNHDLIFESNDPDIICEKFSLKKNSLSRYLNSQKGILYKQLLFSYDKNIK